MTAHSPRHHPFLALSLSLALIVPFGLEPELNLVSGGYIFRQFTESGFLLLNILGLFPITWKVGVRKVNVPK